MQWNGLCIGWTTWPCHGLDGLNVNGTQSDGLDKIHGHLKDYMAHQCNWMDWMHYMATTRFGWIKWNTNAISWIWTRYMAIWRTIWLTHAVRWIGGTAWPWQGLHGLHATRMQLDWFFRIHVHLQDYISHPCNWIDWKDCVVMTRFKCIDCNTNEYDGLNKLHGHLKDYMAHTCN